MDKYQDHRRIMYLLEQQLILLRSGDPPNDKAIEYVEERTRRLIEGINAEIVPIEEIVNGDPE